MNRTQSSFVVYNHSWIVSENSMLCRADSCKRVVVIGPDGRPQECACAITAIAENRKLYELFWDSGYGVFDAEQSLATLNGYVRVDKIADLLLSNDQVRLETFTEYKDTDYTTIEARPNPHCLYLPHDILQSAWNQWYKTFTRDKELVLPRPLLSMSMLITRRHYFNKKYAISVDNKTYPTNVTYCSGIESNGMLLSNTQFTSSAILRISVPLLQAKLIIDGLITRPIEQK